MTRTAIPFDELILRSLQVWDKQWFLLTCGDFASGDFNTMTVAWGSFGTMWHKPFAQIVVRPVRHTFTFLERYDTFTLSAFPKQYKKALGILGTKSGRDGDKITPTGLTPVASKLVASPTFAEAELVVECRKIYWDDFEPTRFLDPGIEPEYPDKDYHRIYFGEILAVEGAPHFRS
jgi:flavin reductase (DIM6/NTAB) family NADH-FMN oxidoreductase RutF